MDDDKFNELPRWKREAVLAEIMQSNKADPATLCIKHGITISDLLDICGIERRPGPRLPNYSNDQERDFISELSITEALELVTEWNAPLELLGYESDLAT